MYLRKAITLQADSCHNFDPLHIVMGGIENFLSRLLKDKIPRYHGILPYSDFYTFTNILLTRFIMQLMSDEKYLLT